MTASLIVDRDEAQTEVAYRLGAGDPEKGMKYAMAIAGWLSSKGENTRRTYRNAVRQFFGMWPRGLSPDQVTTMHAAAFKSRLIEFGKSDATVAHRLDVMTALFDFLMQPSDATGEGLVKSNPFRPVSRSDVRPTPYARSVPVEWQTFKTILDSIPMDPRGMRDRALLLFYAFTGRRKMEVAGMRVRDLALGAKPRSYTVKTKGNKLQTFELPDICYSALKAYWVASGRLSTLRPEQGVFTRIDPNARMMGETPDCPLSPRMAQVILKRRAKAAGVEWKPLKVHGLRHMAARDLNKAGARLQDIQAFLGHANPNTTAIYLGKLMGPAPSLEGKLADVRNLASLIATDEAERSH
jgi:integrase